MSQSLFPWKLRLFSTMMFLRIFFFLSNYDYDDDLPSHFLCYFPFYRSAPSRLWHCHPSLRLPTRTVSNLSIAFYGRCGRAFGPTAGKVWRRSWRRSASSSPSWTPPTPTTTRGRSWLSSSESFRCAIDIFVLVVVVMKVYVLSLRGYLG